MRGLIDDLSTPHALGVGLPAMFQEDDFVQRFVAGLDAVLAPVFWTLENLDAYFDPWLCPVDFLAWLAGWLGETLDDSWPLARQRAFVAGAGSTGASRGTVAGLAEQIERVLGVSAEVSDSGAATWSLAPLTPPPGDAIPTVSVRVSVADVGSFDRRRLETIVAAAAPAHAAYNIEVVST